MTGRKTYGSLDELIDDLDKDSIGNEEAFDLLDEEDLALLHDPVLIKPKPKPRAKPKARAAKKAKGPIE